MNNTTDLAIIAAITTCLAILFAFRYFSLNSKIKNTLAVAAKTEQILRENGEKFRTHAAELHARVTEMNVLDEKQKARIKELVAEHAKLMLQVAAVEQLCDPKNMYNACQREHHAALEDALGAFTFIANDGDAVNVLVAFPLPSELARTNGKSHLLLPLAGSMGDKLLCMIPIKGRVFGTSLSHEARRVAMEQEILPHLYESPETCTFLGITL